MMKLGTEVTVTSDDRSRRAEIVADTPPRRYSRKLSFDLLALSAVGIEAALITTSGMLAGFVALGPSHHGLLSLAVLLGTMLIGTGLHAAGAYSLDALAHPGSRLVRVGAVIAAVCLTLALVVTTLAAPRASTWLWGGAWMAAGVAIVAVARAVLARVLRPWVAFGRFDQRIAVIAPLCRCPQHRALAILCRELSAQQKRNCVTSFHPMAAELGDDVLAQLAAKLREEEIDEVVILGSPNDDQEWIRTLVKGLEVLPVRFSLAVHRPVLADDEARYASLVLVEQPLSASERIAKRGFDIVVSLVALTLLAPLIAAVALAIKLESRGPVLFRQQRYGFNKQIIEVLKFRSMYADMSDQLADSLTLRNDPRVTRVGAFIRKWSLDELPQLLNVLRGDMAIVGPRPHPLNAKAGGSLYEDVVENFYTRYRVRPGITGWAQVNGLRGNTETKEHLIRRVQYDLFYIRNWSLWLDLKIVLLTPLASLLDDNAY